jgi:hypothetical protein
MSNGIREHLGTSLIALILVAAILAIPAMPVTARSGQDNWATITYRLGAGTAEYTLTAEDNCTPIGRVRLSPGESGYLHLEYLPKSGYSIQETQLGVTSTWGGYPSEDVEEARNRVDMTAGQTGKARRDNYYGAVSNAAPAALSYDIPLSKLTYHEEGISPDWLVIAARAKLSDGQSAWASGQGVQPGLPVWLVVIFGLLGAVAAVTGGILFIRKRLANAALTYEE